MAAQHEPMEGGDWVPEDTFGARLALVRQHLGGWNVARIARWCGLDPQSWRNWEAGTKCTDFERNCRKIAAATGCSMPWLMAGGALGQNRKKMNKSDLRLLEGGGETDRRVGALRLA